MRERKPKSIHSESFKSIFDEYQTQVLNICHGILGDRESAQDVCQDVFFRIYKSLDTFQAKSKLSTWIYRIAVNQSLNAVRKRKRDKQTIVYSEQTDQAAYNQATAPSSQHPDKKLELSERKQIIWKAVQSLPENQRTVIILQKYEGFSCQEIADILNCTLSSVQSRMHRAKQGLVLKLRPFLDHL